MDPANQLKQVRNLNITLAQFYIQSLHVDTIFLTVYMVAELDASIAIVSMTYIGGRILYKLHPKDEHFYNNYVMKVDLYNTWLP